MKRELKIITCCENKLMYSWQVRVLANNLRSFDLSDKFEVLVFVDKDTKALDQWKSIQKDYPEIEIFFYLDDEDIRQRIIIPTGYNPLIRPYLLANHYASFPNLEKDAVWYVDTDIALTEKVDFDKYLEDDVVYMSDCKWYLGSKYFDSKIKDVKSEKLYDYHKIDVLDEASRLVGINREICEANFEGSGGAQTLLKGVDSSFFVDLFNSCIELWNYFHFSKGGINRKYFETEEKGFQTWAISDMNGLLWNLWKRGIETKCVSEFNFMWNNSLFDETKHIKIYHDAGYTDGKTSSFNKYAYMNEEPWGINLDEINKKLASHWYAEQILKAKPNIII